MSSTMRKLVVFNNVTLDGYFADRHGDMRWAHRDDAEWTAFGAENASGGGVLLLGRRGPSAMGMSCCGTSGRCEGGARHGRGRAPQLRQARRSALPEDRSQPATSPAGTRCAPRESDTD